MSLSFFKEELHCLTNCNIERRQRSAIFRYKPLNWNGSDGRRFRGRCGWAGAGNITWCIRRCSRGCCGWRQRSRKITGHVGRNHGWGISRSWSEFYVFVIDDNSHLKPPIFFTVALRHKKLRRSHCTSQPSRNDILDRRSIPKINCAGLVFTTTR